MYDDFEITEEDGIVHLHSIDGVISVIPHETQKFDKVPPEVEPGKHGIFTRNWIKMPVGENGERREIRGRVVVAELDGVRVYVKGNQIIMTKQDLYF